LGGKPGIIANGNAWHDDTPLTEVLVREKNDRPPIETASEKTRNDVHERITTEREIQRGTREDSKKRKAPPFLEKSEEKGRTENRRSRLFKGGSVLTLMGGGPHERKGGEEC